MRKIVFLLISLSFFIACKKSSNNNGNNNVVTPADSTPSQYGTPFAGVPDTKDIVMYSVNIRAFSATNNFAGVVARLDSIKALGVNVIWLMPTYPVGTDSRSINSPYCVKDYFGVNSNFGTLTDLQNLVSMAHADGMAVIMDWVADHTSFDNAWTYNTSWYQLNSGGQIISPPGFSDVAALNYNSYPMRQNMISAMKYWILAANVDGYRCDDANPIPENFWAQALDTLNTLNHKLIFLAEDDRDSDFYSGFQMTYDYEETYFQHLVGVFGGTAASGLPSQAYSLIGINNSDITGSPSIPATDRVLRYTSTQDEDHNIGTPMSSAFFQTDNGSIAAFVITAYMGGVPLIYNGQEVGCPVQLDFFSDHPSYTINWSQNPNFTAIYKQLIAFRNANDAVKEGSILYFGTSNNDVSAFERTSSSDTVLVLVNVRNNSVTYPVDAALQNTAWYDGMNNNAMVNLTTSVTLPAYGYMILKKQ